MKNFFKAYSLIALAVISPASAAVTAFSPDFSSLGTMMDAGTGNTSFGPSTVSWDATNPGAYTDVTVTLSASSAHTGVGEVSGINIPAGGQVPPPGIDLINYRSESGGPTITVTLDFAEAIDMNVFNVLGVLRVSGLEGDGTNPTVGRIRFSSGGTALDPTANGWSVTALDMGAHSYNAGTGYYEFDSLTIQDDGTIDGSIIFNQGATTFDQISYEVTTVGSSEISSLVVAGIHNVPEPSTTMLFCASLMGLWVRRAR